MARGRAFVRIFSSSWDRDRSISDGFVRLGKNHLDEGCAMGAPAADGGAYVSLLTRTYRTMERTTCADDPAGRVGVVHQGLSVPVEHQSAVAETSGCRLTDSPADAETAVEDLQELLVLGRASRSLAMRATRTASGE